MPSDRAASRSNNPIVGQEEGIPSGYPAGGGESGSIAPHPTDPNIFFATGPQSLITRYDRRLGLSQARDVQVLPSWESGAQRERFPWTTALVASRLEPDVLYVGSQHLWRSAKRGDSWERISPDLTRSPGGAISVIAPSRQEPRTLWVGTDDGAVQLTRDGGATWTAMTPPGLPDSSRVSAIESSAHAAATAYLSVERHEVDDRRPYLFRTTDLGAHWTAITTGLGSEDFVNVVREDSQRAGLLYAGTDHGVAVSFDAGASWQSLAGNLPDVPVVDLVVEANDLVIATHGRSFYVLDDIGPLRQLGSDLAGKPLHLFRPADPVRRLDEAVIDYVLAAAADTVTIEVLDRAGSVVRRHQAAGRAGANRFRWDLRHTGATTVAGMIFWVSRPVGPLALPGEYQVRVTANGATATERFTIRPDPRIPNVTAADLEEQFALALRVRDLVSETNEAVIRIRALGTELRDRGKTARDLGPGIEALLGQLDEVKNGLYQTKLRSELDATIYPIRLNNQLTNLQMSIETGDGRPTAQARSAVTILAAELTRLRSKLAAIVAGPLADLNRRLTSRRLKPVAAPE